MITQLRSRPVCAVAVTAATAALAVLLFLGTGWIYFLPVMVVIALVRNTAVAYWFTCVAVPLAGALFLRSPWWARWACLGILLGNVGLTVYFNLAVGLGALGS
jgi:hypothetical protein